MKKITLFFNVFICLAFAGSLRAQTFVSTEPSNRNVVLEEYTGVECSNCPGGHKISNQLAADNPDRVVLLNIHQGFYANVIPDYKTKWGDALANQASVIEYPSGTVNRHVFIGSNTVLGRTDWSTYAAQILKQPSCVNVAAQSTIDWKTRKLTVIVEAYYTESSKKSTNMLNVAILQENILGRQFGAVNYPEMKVGYLYRHNHMLRDLITGQWGETIPETTKGSFFTKTYTYDIPLDYKKVPVDMADINIAVFIAEDKSEIITGSISSIKQEYSNDPDVSMKDLYCLNEVYTCDNDIQVEMVVRNTSSHNIESYTVKCEVEGVENPNSTYNITGRSVAVGMTDTVSLPLIHIIANKNNNFTATVIKANDMDLNSLDRQKTIVVLKDTAMTTTNSLIIKVWQDQYGSETSWKLFNSGGQVIASEGPYTNLGTKTTQLHSKEVGSLAPDCYYFRIYDTFGDGINTTFGSGKYEIWAGNRLLHSSNGKFNLVETKNIQIGDGTGVNIVEDLTENWQIYPNPVNDKMTISFTLNNTGNIAVSVCDILGREVITKDKVLYAEGNHTVEINTQQLRAGGYIVKLQTGDGVVCKKILVRK